MILTAHQPAYLPWLGLMNKIERKGIIIEHNVFIGSHCIIKKGARIGHHSVIAAGTVIEGIEIPLYSLAFGNPMKIKASYYNKFFKK